MEVITLKIVCIGDSLTHGYKIKLSEVWTSLMEESFGLPILNKGIIGETTNDMLERFPKDVVINNPSHVIIMGGTNDIIKGFPLSRAYSNIITMTQQALANKIIPIIGLQILCDPTMAKEYWPHIPNFFEVNEQIKELRKRLLKFSNEFNIQVIDFYEEVNRHITENNKSLFYLDGVHLTSKGNEFMARAACQKIQFTDKVCMLY